MEGLDAYVSEEEALDVLQVSREVRVIKKPKLSNTIEELQHGQDDAELRKGSLLESLCEVIRHVVPSAEMIQRRHSDWNRFEQSILLSKFPELNGKSSIELFGSWTYGMWTPESDVDCNIRTESPIPSFFNKLKSAVMSEYPCSTIRIISNCKVPVIKILLPGELRIDITHECGPDADDESRHNHLVRDWASRWQNNEVICTSIRVIKRWATAKKIHNPLSGSLNSMGYLVMLLAIIDPEDCCDQSHGLFSKENLEKVSKVLLRFFRTYRTIGQKKEVIYAPHGTVRKEGSELDIARLTGSVDDRNHRGFGTTLFIQDPFLPRTNLGRFVDKYSIKSLRTHFSRAFDILQEGSQNAFQILVTNQ
jgi:DNA polymerase sigma